MKVAVIGTGYVGLVTGTCLAASGREVVCIDRDRAKIAKLLGGEMPIYEPGLDAMVGRAVDAGLLSFTTDLAAGIAEADLVFLAVGTPQSEDGSADLSGIFAAGCEVARNLTAPKIIVIRSTVPVGTNAELARRMAGVTDVPFQVASNPEFLKEGAAIDDFNTPDRVVVGTRTPEVTAALHELYAPFVGEGRPFLAMTPESAEMTKYVANCMLATKISFINEMANLSTAVGAEIDDVRKGIGHDRRIGFQFLSPGPGYGGSCFPKDVRALTHLAGTKGVATRVMDAVDAANEAQKDVLGRMVLGQFPGEGRGLRVAIWGLAFKAETDDIRESPALRLIDTLLAAGVEVRVHDPEATANVRAIYGPRLTYCEHRYEAVERADALVVVTDWSEYRNPDNILMHALMRRFVVIDGRNMLDPERVARFGFTYLGIGRTPRVVPNAATPARPAAPATDPIFDGEALDAVPYPTLGIAAGV